MATIRVMPEAWLQDSSGEWWSAGSVVKELVENASMPGDPDQRGVGPPPIAHPGGGQRTA